MEAQGGVRTKGGIGAGIDAATSVLIPILAFLWLSSLSLFRAFSGWGGSREGWEQSEGWEPESMQPHLFWSLSCRCAILR